MEFKIKIIFSIIAFLVMIGIYFIDPKTDNAGPDWIWAGRKKDPIRNILFKNDGSLRKYSKQGLCGFLMFMLFLIWNFEF